MRLQRVQIIRAMAYIWLREISFESKRLKLQMRIRPLIKRLLLQVFKTLKPIIKQKPWRKIRRIGPLLVVCRCWVSRLVNFTLILLQNLSKIIIKMKDLVYLRWLKSICLVHKLSHNFRSCRPLILAIFRVLTH